MGDGGGGREAALLRRCSSSRWGVSGRRLLSGAGDGAWRAHAGMVLVMLACSGYHVLIAKPVLLNAGMSQPLLENGPSVLAIGTSCCCSRY